MLLELNGRVTESIDARDLQSWLLLSVERLSITELQVTIGESGRDNEVTEL